MIRNVRGSTAYETEQIRQKIQQLRIIMAELDEFIEEHDGEEAFRSALLGTTSETVLLLQETEEFIKLIQDPQPVDDESETREVG
ncbi:hypothetical protein ACFQE1_03265 [Halobium palmae]|uniref:Uncharacterized protein n=1 Tax=Halobium palmae TaxID=1776492 RepID=A0ABD5RVY8_9EURY